MESENQHLRPIVSMVAPEEMLRQSNNCIAALTQLPEWKRTSIVSDNKSIKETQFEAADLVVETLASVAHTHTVDASTILLMPAPGFKPSPQNHQRTGQNPVTSTKADKNLTTKNSVPPARPQSAITDLSARRVTLD